ncbi:MAG: hypothetical protein H6816_15550, partial [Phycisphaerales bacterium]|nr:hypothetical protein [Phycisphaerales bacterium]
AEDQSRARKEAENQSRARKEAEVPTRAGKQAEANNPLADADGIIVLDTCSFSQLTPVADFLRETAAPIIALDHHRTRDLPCTRYLVDAESAAASLLLFDWARAADWPLPAEAAALLFVGIATDTGWFRHSNTSPAALRAAADLLDRGVDLDHWYQTLYLADPTRALRARSAAMASLELHPDDRVAVMMVTQQTLREIGANPTDLEEVVNAPMSAAQVEVSILLTEREDGTTKASLRSKGRIDVAQLAAHFGGGGHTRAAGARLQLSLADAQKALLAACPSPA